MANLMDLLQGQLQSGLLEQLTGQLGGASKEQTQSATNLALSTILGALNKNAAKPEGLQGLFGALEKTHDGGILENIGDLLSGSSNSKAADGMGILSHLLGGSNIFNIVNAISKGSGLSRNNSMNLMMKLAPVALGMLGKQKKEQHMQPSNLLDYLKTSNQQVQQKMPQQNLIEKMLDRDGDGSVMDEIAGMGMKALGGLFR